MPRNNNRFRRGGGGGRGRGGRSHSNSNSRNRSNRTSATPTKKTLKDHMHYIGSAKQASDYVTTTAFIMNHIRISFTKGGDIADAIENEKELDFDKEAPKLKMSSADPKDEAAKREREQLQFSKQFEIEYALHSERAQQHKDNKGAAAATLWKQCSNIMRSKIQSRKDYDSEVKGDPIKLLQAIKQHSMSYESTQCRMKTTCDAMKTLINQRMKEEEKSIDYLKRFKASRDVFYSHVGKDFAFPLLLEDHENMERPKKF